MFEVREVLRLWLRGEGIRSVERLAGLDRKTVRRYVAAAEELGLPGVAGLRVLGPLEPSEAVARCRGAALVQEVDASVIDPVAELRVSEVRERVHVVPCRGEIVVEKTRQTCAVAACKATGQFETRGRPPSDLTCAEPVEQRSDEDASGSAGKFARAHRARFEVSRRGVQPDRCVLCPERYGTNRAVIAAQDAELKHPLRDPSQSCDGATNGERVSSIREDQRNGTTRFAQSVGDNLILLGHPSRIERDQHPGPEIRGQGRLFLHGEEPRTDVVLVPRNEHTT